MKVKSRIIVPKIKIVTKILYNNIINNININRPTTIKKAKPKTKIVDITPQKSE